MKNRIYKTVILFLIFSSFKYSSAGEKIILTALNSMERIGQDQKIDGAATVKIQSARNEVESFQVVVSAPKENIKVIKVEISDLIGPKGSKIEKENIKLFREEYVRVRMSTPRANGALGISKSVTWSFVINSCKAVCLSGMISKEPSSLVCGSR
ncbi:unnamed protein product [marine sediment metagenome]|uniref:Uncharacterized protein n=1 Tax=marine sediment metagenome TaxID=412755 RepID=X1T845_9ZZZZ